MMNASFSFAVMLLLACTANAFAPTTPRVLVHLNSRVVSSDSQSTTTTASSPIFLFGKKKEEAAAVVEEAAPAAPVEEQAEAEGDANKLNLMSKIKDAGAAGAVSLFLWELAFWAISIPVAIVAFVQLNDGAFPDFGNSEDVAKVGAEAFAFANVARFALPVRIGLAVSTTPWVKDNIVDAPWAKSLFDKKKEGDDTSSEE